jgi:hypothetical protein
MFVHNLAFGESTMKTTFITFLFLANAVWLFAQAPDTLWTRTYGGSGGEEAYAVVQTPDGGYAIAGYTNSFGAGNEDFYLVRTDAAGGVLWYQSYGSFLPEIANDMVQTTDGGFLIAGYAEPYGEQRSDFFVVRTDEEGDTVWTRAYGDTHDERAYGVCRTRDGGYVLIGTIQPFYRSESASIYLIKINDAGGIIWTRTYSGGYRCSGYDVQQTLDGGFIVAGAMYTGDDYDFYVLKLDSLANVEWTQSYGSYNYDMAYAVVETRDGGYAVGGSGVRSGVGWGNADFVLVRLNHAGELSWARWYDIGNSAESVRANCLQQTSDGGYILAMASATTSYTPYDVWIIKTNSIGDTVWTRRYGGDGFDYGYAVAQTADDGYIIVGSSNSFNAGNNFDFYVIKTCLDVTLPVELAAFDAVSISSGIRLSFSTASETNNDYFEIMRGTSESGAFNRIHTLPSQGNSSTAHQYEYLDREVMAGQTYWYYLADVDLNGNRTEHRELMRSATMTGSAELPSDYSLAAYPNPFNPSTTISFALPEAEVVRIAVFDVAGRWIQTLVNEKRGAGKHTVSFDARDLPSGVYFARMESGPFTMTKKMLLIK